MNIKTFMSFLYFFSGCVASVGVDLFFEKQYSGAAVFALVSFGCFFGAEIIVEAIYQFHIKLIKNIGKKCTCDSPLEQHSCVAHAVFRELNMTSLAKSILARDELVEKYMKGKRL